MAKIPEASLAQFTFITTANANTNAWVALNSNITQQVRIVINVGTATRLGSAADANSVDTNNTYYIRSGGSGDFQGVLTPSRTFVRSDGATTSACYCHAWTLEHKDIA